MNSIFKHGCEIRMPISSEHQFSNSNILIVNNGYLQLGVSGGDAHLLSVGAEWAKQNKVTFLIPGFAENFVGGAADCCSYRAWIPQSTLGIVIAYLYRMIRSGVTAWRFRADVTVAGGILVDMLPAWINAVRSKSFLVLYVFHLIPKRRGKNAAQSVQYLISWIAQQIALSFYRRADIIFTDNSLVKEELTARGISPEKIHLQYPVVEVEAIRRAIPLKAHQILFIGRLVRQKGVYDLLEAVAPLNVTVGIVGKGEEQAGLIEFIRQHNMSDRVDLLGFLPVEEKHRRLKGCALFVLPSYEEGYGIVVGEAIAAGRPVVVYELPHYKEVFKDSLLFVPLGNVAALRERIQSALCDTELERRVREQYKEVVLRSAAVAAEEESLIIRKMMHRRGSPSIEAL
ncbi:MAG: glycosyltransferase family 4 protein [Kiritimatiellales bacterium]